MSSSSCSPGTDHDVCRESTEAPGAIRAYWTPERMAEAKPEPKETLPPYLIRRRDAHSTSQKKEKSDAHQCLDLRDRSPRRDGC